MSNPTFSTGNLTREAGATVEKFRLVRLVDGKVQHATADALPYGAVTEAAAPEADREDNYLAHGLPRVVRVHAAQCVLPLATDGTDFADGDTVYAAADGKVAKTGTVGVGLVDRAESGGLVRVHLFHPAGTAVAGD
ncbi:hypothetical protein G6031_09605 [Dietzia sp. CQ4]|uniref:hypothetical protein n=1 Tax=Dietzia sp. (strain CQ4) TaxID=370437 RepID=UPI0015FB142E|nr:hypothetical protein [Dietzia sp. CQ4]MBB1034643.1 hypothetical protein [Dietzia sp. CQ4]